MGKPQAQQEPDAGIGLFRNLVDPNREKPKPPEAGIGLFSHYGEHDEPESWDTGGLFSHWIEY